MARETLYAPLGLTCAKCFASIHHYVLVDEIAYCEDDAPDDFTDETWLKFDEDDDEDPSHTATVERNDDEGYVVNWWHEDVGLVTDVNFDTLEDAHAWLESAGYADYTA